MTALPSPRLLAASAATLLALSAFWWWPTDARQVVRSMDRLLENLEVHGPESPVIAAARSMEATGYLTATVRLRLGEPFPSTLGKPEARSLLAQARMRADRIALSTRGHQLQRENADRFRMEVTLEASVEVGSEREAWIGAYRLIWIRDEGTWRIAEAEGLDIVLHPGKLNLP
jgi:hypothetical protein